MKQVREMIKNANDKQLLEMWEELAKRIWKILILQLVQSLRQSWKTEI